LPKLSGVRQTSIKLMQLIKSIYNAVVSEKLRWKIWIFRNKHVELGTLRKQFLQYYKALPEREKTAEIDEVVNFVQQYGIFTFPYSFTFNYNVKDVEVYRDQELDLPYVLLNGKKLYYKRSWSDLAIKETFNFLSIEQDLQSPHKYLTDTFQVNHGDAVADIGAAEGNFGLSVIEKVSKLYIFEADPDWIEALQATFAQWKDKVHIVNKYVADVTDDDSINLDEYLNDQEPINFLKIDTEGAEARVLKGADKTLEGNPNLKITICTYDKQNDGNDLADILKGHNFNITYSDGYMFFLEDIQTPPFLRRGLIRAYKG
jgi:hypothetical protein